MLDYFYDDLLNGIYKENNPDPASIYNLDETGLNTDPRSKEVFVDPKSKDAYLMFATCGKIMYSVLFCCSATGRYLPPFVVYKG